MKKILDREFKLGNKDYDLDFLVTQFELLSLDIKTNPSLFFTTLMKLNKRFCKFYEKTAMITQGIRSSFVFQIMSWLLIA